MKKFLLLFFAGIVITPLFAACGKTDDNIEPIVDSESKWVHEPDSSKVLIIGVDGCLNAAITPALMPNLHQLAQESWYSSNALAQVPTWSCTGWASILTGTGPAKHNYLINEWPESKTNLTTYPALFKYLKELKPGWRTSSVVAWSVLHNFLITQDMVTMRYSNSDDGAVENKAKEELALKDAPELMFVHFDGVDHAGHDKGFDETAAPYQAAVTTADARIGRLLTAVRNRPDYARERWLIIVVADHGGNGTSHGGSSYKEMNAFIVLNAKSIRPALVNTPPTVTPTPVVADTDGNVVYKDGVYTTLPALPALDFGTDKSFTIEMDVRLDVVNTEDPSFFGNKNWDNGTNPGITFVSRSQGQFMINVADGSNRVDMRFDNVLSDKKWHRVAFAFDRSAGQVTVYIDGVKRDPTSLNGSLSMFATMGSLSSTYPFRIAQDGTGAYGCVFNGGVKELRVFSGVAVDGATLAAYSAKSLDNQHPAIANLAIYNPGNFSGTTLAGALGMPALTITTGLDYDYHDAPYLYNIVPTIFSFYGLPIKPEYKWDGAPLVAF